MTSGVSAPRWQVKQVTRGCPPKKLRLMVFIMTTICRARSMRGVETANASRRVRISWTWQPVQSNRSEEANIPIVSMNSSAGIPLRTWMFLKTFSDIGAAGSCGAV